jgi:malate dehydrogenase
LSSQRIKCHDPVRVAITGARGSVGGNLAFRVAMGDMFGINQPVILQLYSRDLKALEGLRMELEDTCGPLLAGIVVSNDYEAVFGDADYACLVGSPPRGKGMERSDLLRMSGELFAKEGQILGQVAKENCKVVVVGNPANTNALIAASNSRRIPRENFTALMRLDQNRAMFQLCEAINKSGRLDYLVHPSDISDVIIWGNHSATMCPDISHAHVHGEKVVDILEPMIRGGWLEKEFIPTVQQRGKAIIDARGSSSAPSAALACVDQMRDWVLGSNNRSVSMAVISSQGGRDEYGIDTSLCFSYPIISGKKGNWSKVKGLELSEYVVAGLKANQAELIAERDAVRHLLKH